MTDTKELLTKIAALRNRLEQAQGMVQAAGSAAAALLDGGDAVAALAGKVANGASQQAQLDAGLRQLTGFSEAGGTAAALPAQLTARAARLLRRAHDLLGQLRALGDDSLLARTDEDHLAQLHRETVSMTDTVLRTVQAFPESPSAQIRLCEGLDAVLHVVAERLTVVDGVLRQRRQEVTRRETLAELLAALADGYTIECAALEPLAQAVLDDAAQGLPLHWPEVAATDLPRHIAAHSLAVAQVMARVIRHDVEWRAKPLEPILAALVHDAGMLKLPPLLLAHPGPLKDEHRRMVDAHPILSAEMALRVTPTAAWLIEASGQHHERLDGTGYPTGLRDMQLKALPRLLAVCDGYAAMCQPRAHRAALDTRTALTDTLLLAEKGYLDRNCAEKLLLLSFYPVGSVVELSDGAVGVVVATHQGRRDLNAPARPVVALLTDEQGQPLAGLRHVDLAEVEGRAILRGLPAAELRDRVGRRYPELAA